MDDVLCSLLRELERFGAENDARVCERREMFLNITPETGELLAILAVVIKAQRILEIGTSNGYSTLWLANAIRTTNGRLITVEISVERAEMAWHNILRAGLSPWVSQQVMDAGEFLRHQPPCEYDLIFLDSNRDNYLAWWRQIEQALLPGGLLVVDNANSHAAEMHEFMAHVRAAPGWRSVVLPVGKGELVVLKPM